MKTTNMLLKLIQIKVKRKVSAISRAVCTASETSHCDKTLVGAHAIMADHRMKIKKLLVLMIKLLVGKRINT